MANAPELVAQHSHSPFHGDQKTFEDALRQLLRDSPYMVISVLVHAMIFLVFATGAPPAPSVQPQVIQAAPEQIEDVIPPPLPPPPLEIEKERELIDEPTISETTNNADEVTTDVVAADTFADYATGKGEFDNTGMNDVIGVGAGGGQGFGKLGGRGGSAAGKGGAGKAGGEPLNRAVDDALRWLKNHQSADGHWSCADFDTECGKGGTDTVCDGLGSPQFDVGCTGLALLAFLGADNTDQHGRYQKTVKQALRWLVKIQGPDGNFGDTSFGKYTYDHIIATLAMTEAYALTRNHLFKAPTEKALKYMYKIRNAGSAWRYSKSDPEMTEHPDDMSVTGWAIITMTLAREYGLPCDENALEESLLFLEQMTDPASGATGYFDPGQQPARTDSNLAGWPPAQSESITAVGVLCRIFADPKLERPGNKALIELGIKRISKLPPVWSDDQPGRRDFYYWYYATYALYQYGGEPWKAWEATLLPAIAAHQHKEGERSGSWDPQLDPWGADGGRVYSTAILALCLEVFYRYETVIGAH